MSLFATEKVPQPMAIDGIVRNDFNSRTLVVKRPEKTRRVTKNWRGGQRMSTCIGLSRLVGGPSAR